MPKLPIAQGKTIIVGGQEMYITASQVEGNVPVTVFRIQGELDASNYQRLVTRVTEAHNAGVRDVLLDLSEVSFMSSSGLVALHSIALLLRGETPPDPASGWGALRSIDRDREAGLQQHVKLLNLQPGVDRVIRMAGFDRFFEIFTEEDVALSSF